MMRALSSCWRAGAILLLAFVLVGLTGSAAHAGKPTVAVLGLEVVDPTGQIDQTSTTVARDLTDALRSRAKLPTGPYQFQPGSEKELIDEKLIKNCDNEAIPCMSQIGKDLGADFLIYGRLERKPDGYAVTINLLNVGKKKFEKSKSPLVIPQSSKDATAIQSAAKKAYNDLVGVAETGTLVVRTNAERGTVLLDDEPKGALNSGSATVSAPEGRYRLAVEADGFQRSQEIVVTMRSGETTTQPVTLVEVPKTGGTTGTTGNGTGKPDDLKHEITGTTSSSKSNIWKPMFVASVVVGLGAGGFWAYSYFSEQSAAKDVAAELKTAGISHGKLSQSDCSNSMLTGGSASLSDACKFHDWTTYGIVGTVAAVALVGVTGYMAFGRGSSESPTKTGTTTSRGRVRKPEFSITPVVQANGGGATFRLDW